MSEEEINNQDNLQDQAKDQVSNAPEEIKPDQPENLPEEESAKPEQFDKADEPVAAGSTEPLAADLQEIVAPEVKGERRWYVIQVMTSLEDRVKQALEVTIKEHSLQNKVFQVLVPTEEIVEIKGGKRIEKVKKMFPGYVFLEMILDEQSWYLIRQTAGVARFIGTKVQPTPVSAKEMQRVLKQLGKEERLEVNFEKGEGVRVISGPFRGYTGTVDEVNIEKGKLKALINIFGRDTPVEVNFEHAQKIV
jgi:transcriptional antiterminator NusG